jgi:hypothetical protein
MITSSAWSNILSVAALLVCNPSWADLTYSLKPEAVRAGERATLTIRLPQRDLMRPAGMDPEEAPDAQDDYFMQAPGLMILDRDVKIEDGAYVWRYDVTGYQPGRVTLPPIAIKLGPQNFSTVSLSLEITTGRAAGDTALRAEFDELPYPFPWRTVIEVALCAALGFWAYRRLRPWIARRWPRRERGESAPAEPPEDDRDWLRRRFGEMRARWEKMEDPAAVDELTATLRTYFARRTRLPVSALTTAEFRRQLAGDASAAEIVPIFSRCDRFKFAPDARPPAVQLAGACLAESERILL